MLSRLEACQDLSRYLEGTAILEITIAPTQDYNRVLRLRALSDADFAAFKADRESITDGMIDQNGMEVICGGGA